MNLPILEECVFNNTFLKVHEKFNVSNTYKLGYGNNTRTTGFIVAVVQTVVLKWIVTSNTFFKFSVEHVIIVLFLINSWHNLYSVIFGNLQKIYMKELPILMSYTTRLKCNQLKNHFCIEISIRSNIFHNFKTYKHITLYWLFSLSM